ncbi:Cupin 2 conserved barrel domain protein [Stanieria cyanosphaera PCC 7437]|uniref:Cupin 2 conserved barrel domain protein n=1 Tax=Stanieria cyanosphaera (strain ATCC 29371 / PCC 7437) TaxID=111780 RepID=K9XT86_STAC7|nr:cupin domain-containing protein [Stanieria cyanosphaera]AFZ35291.1 Cupin 2 conserved barrel domain protein [Stanieria cyanosphaera PCC 7437]
MIIDPQKISGQRSSNYPQQFQTYISGRIKKKLGNFAGLKNFGVNLVTLEPGSRSALRHWHTKQDEFIYILFGEATLVTNAGEQILPAGMAAGFPAGEADGHHLLNRSNANVVYIEIGDRTPEDTVDYPDEDLMAKDQDGVWIFTHKNGSVYDS